MGKVINDFVINVATANGTGSQSSNLVILHSMFEMGVPARERIFSQATFPASQHGLSLGPARKGTRPQGTLLTYRS